MALFLFGDSVMRLMFPAFGGKSIALLHILILVVVSETLISLMQPFVMKFTPIRIIPVVNSINIAAILVSAVFMIPNYEASGAAWAIVFGSVVTGALWAIVVCRLFKGRMSSRIQRGACRV